MYRFTRVRFGKIAGLTAMLLTYMTWAYAEAAFTARPYGLLLGAFGLALVSWQHAASRNRRGLALIGLTLGLAVALLSHCYAVMLFIPIVLGELARSASARRLDWPVWIAILAPAPLVFSYLPILEGASSVLAHTWGSPRWTQPLDFHRSTVNSLVMPLTAISVVLGTATWRFWIGEIEWPSGSSFRTHEAAALVGLFLLPTVGVVLGKTVTGIFTERYAMAALAGYAIVLGAAAGLHRAAGRLWGVALVAILILWWVKTEWRFAPQTNPALGLAETSLSDRGELPIVVTRGMLFFELARHSPPETIKRIVYPVAPAQAIRFSNTDLFDVGLPMINEYFGLGLGLPDYRDFVESNKSFILYGPFTETTYDKSIWIVEKLLEDGARVTLLHHGASGEPMALVEMPSELGK